MLTFDLEYIDTCEPIYLGGFHGDFRDDSAAQAAVFRSPRGLVLAGYLTGGGFVATDEAIPAGQDGAAIAEQFASAMCGT